VYSHNTIYIYILPSLCKGSIVCLCCQCACLCIYLEPYILSPKSHFISPSAMIVECCSLRHSFLRVDTIPKNQQRGVHRVALRLCVRPSTAAHPSKSGRRSFFFVWVKTLAIFTASVYPLAHFVYVRPRFRHSTRYFL
jgi:hypothetical protein